MSSPAESADESETQAILAEGREGKSFDTSKEGEE